MQTPSTSLTQPQSFLLNPISNVERDLISCSSSSCSMRLLPGSIPSTTLVGIVMIQILPELPRIGQYLIHHRQFRSDSQWIRTEVCNVNPTGILRIRVRSDSNTSPVSTNQCFKAWPCPILSYTSQKVSAQWLGENICNLITCLAIYELHLFLFDFMLDEMVTCLDMFTLFMCYWVLCKCNRRLVVNIEWYRSLLLLL